MIARSQAPDLWRRDPGSYLLLVHLPGPASLSVGRLGCVALEPGRYVYLGSALGPGGVASRVNRHLRPGKRIHWHIDYLTSVAPVVGVSAAYGPGRFECHWAHALEALDGASAPVAGFGSSDCRSGCIAHLWRLPDELPTSWIQDELTQCPIHTI